MAGTDVALLGLVGLSCANAFRFENRLAENLKEVRELKKTVEAYRVALQENEAAELEDKIGLLETASHFEGNWLPSKYRQVIVACVLSLGVTAMTSSEEGLAAFVFCCLFLSTGALRFWLGMFAKLRR